MSSKLPFLMVATSALGVAAWAASPAPLTLTMDGLARQGSQVWVEVSGATPGAMVVLGSGDETSPNATCYPQACVDIASPYIHGSATADANGVAAGWLGVPAQAPGPLVRWFQAVEIAAGPRTSNVVPRLVTHPTRTSAFPWTEFDGAIQPDGTALGTYTVHYTSGNIAGSVDVCTWERDALGVTPAIACPGCDFAFNIQSASAPREVASAGDCDDAGFSSATFGGGFEYGVGYDADYLDYYSGSTPEVLPTVLYQHYGGWIQPFGDLFPVSLTHWDPATGEFGMVASYYWGNNWAY